MSEIYKGQKVVKYKFVGGFEEVLDWGLIFSFNVLKVSNSHG